ncbi:MAG: HAD-IB family hydrolase [Clostridium sp.]|nr:HAD-IB family hydrolase [Clostridium sp.]
MKKVAAFYDIDGTLYRDGFISELFKKFIKSEIIEEEKWFTEVKPYFDQWDRRRGTYDTYLDKMANIYIMAIKGYHKSFIEHIIDKVVAEKGERTYVYTRDRIKWHRNKGHTLITISGSPKEVVSKVADLYGFDDYRGSDYIISDEDRYTGQVIPMWDSRSKREATIFMAEKHNIDLSKSYAYGDTAGDFSMFKLVGNPVLINPTKELIKLVLNDDEVKRKAKIVVERKDVIYKLNIDSLDIE